AGRAWLPGVRDVPRGIRPRHRSRRTRPHHRLETPRWPLPRDRHSRTHRHRGPHAIPGRRGVTQSTGNLRGDEHMAILSGRNGLVKYDPAATTPTEIISINAFTISWKTDKQDV